MNDDVIDVEAVDTESVERKSIIGDFAERAGAALGDAINRADEAKTNFYDAVDKANIEQKTVEAAQKAEETITSVMDSFTKGYSSKRQ